LKVTYTRLYADSSGDSHFADVSEPLEPTDFAPPAPLLHASPSRRAERLVFVGSPNEWDGRWHPTPTRQFVICLAGTLEVTVSDGETRVFEPGDFLLVEDTEGRGHKTQTAGQILTAVVQLE
jgi:hypothetical protein